MQTSTDVGLVFVPVLILVSGFVNLHTYIHSLLNKMAAQVLE